MKDDLGARKIREELDALQVLGVDPIENLVVPRFLALMVVTGLFNIYALIFGIFGGALATLTFDAPLGPFFATLLNNATVTDLWGSVVKTTLFGGIIAIVSCYKGMTASGGAEGVGRAVNQGVVIAFLGIFAFNYVFTQTLLATHPEISVLALAIVAGSAFLWIGIPLLGFWLAGELTTTNQGFLFAALGGVPLAMVVFGWLLYRLNDLYVGLQGDERQAAARRAAWLVSSSDERGRLRRARAPRSLIDVSMTASAVTALVLLVIWFFFFAEMKLVTPQ